MTIEKLPSGSYRVKQMYKGKYYSRTIDHKPTKKEAALLIADALQDVKSTAAPGTVKAFMERYIDLCVRDGKSPTTTKNYKSVVRNLSEDFLNINFNDCNSKHIQNEMDRYGATRSPKTVQNAYGLISAVFAKYRPEYKISVNLPAQKEIVEYEPTTKDIERILELSEGTRYELALKLSAMGLRRGELMAINPAEDLDEDNVLSINKALALNDDNMYVLKSTKTAASVRRIPLPDDIADLMRKQGYVFDGNPHTINETLHKYQDRLGIPRFRLHIMRHFAAAYLHKLGFTDEQIMAWLGWNTASTLQRVYRYNLDPAESQKKMKNAFTMLMDKQG